MAKRGDKPSKQAERPRGGVVETVTDVIVDADGTVTPVSGRTAKALHKLEKKLAAARKTEAKRLRQLQAAEGTKGRKQVAKRTRKATDAASEVSSLSAKLQNAAAEAAGSAAATAAPPAVSAPAAPAPAPRATTARATAPRATTPPASYRLSNDAIVQRAQARDDTARACGRGSAQGRDARARHDADGRDACDLSANRAATRKPPDAGGSDNHRQADGPPPRGPMTATSAAAASQ